jgi:hypothetical protein
MPPRKRKHRSSRSKVSYSRQTNIFTDLWDGFWDKPMATCPKCKSTFIDYYDPFLFAPWRTLTGRRRYKCQKCGFIWRKSRSDSIINKSGMVPRR